MRAPAATSGLADDLLDYLIAYGGRLSPSAFVDRFAALISLRLFQLPLRIARAARHVLASGTKSPDMLDERVANSLELYCDFTARRGSASDDLARQCVQRDLEILRAFLSDRLLLRSLREAMSALRQQGDEIKNLPMADSLIAMVGLREDPYVTAHASIQMQEIEALNSGSEEDQEFIGQ